ncbi:hypothetical protein, partial [Bacillus toyonensis]
SGTGLSFFYCSKQFLLGGLNMAILKDTTYIEMNTHNEIRFFKGIFWGIVFVVPFWSMMIALFIWLCK